MTDPLVVAIVHGAVPRNAPPDEQDSLVQAQAVTEALAGLGFVPVQMAADSDLAQLRTNLLKLRPAFVFNLVDSLAGNARLIAAVPETLEAMGLPFTGAPAEAIRETSNKLAAKRVLAASGIPTPASTDFADPSRMTTEEPDGGQWIVKSVWEHASVGIDDRAIVSDQVAAVDRINKQRHRFGGAWFAETFVAGREFNVSVLEVDGRPRVLPVAEIDFTAFPEGKPHIVGYEAKWQPETFEYRYTPRRFAEGEVDADLVGKLSELAIACWGAFGLRGYARVDFRVDTRDRPWVLEVNANPCLSPDSGFAAAAFQGGISYRELVGHIVAHAQPGVVDAGPGTADRSH